MQLTESTAIKSAKRAGFRRSNAISLRIDMTPMVDLGFLLISFFVIATQLSEPKAMNLYMPKDGPPMTVGESGALTLMLEKDNTIYYYHGNWEMAFEMGAIYKTSYAGDGGIRRILEEKQRALDVNTKFQEGRDGLMLIIKPGDNSSYKNVVDVLDEVMISNVKKYAIIPLNSAEIDWLTVFGK